MSESSMWNLKEMLTNSSGKVVSATYEKGLGGNRITFDVARKPDHEVPLRERLDKLLMRPGFTVANISGRPPSGPWRRISIHRKNGKPYEAVYTNGHGGAIYFFIKATPVPMRAETTAELKRHPNLVLPNRGKKRKHKRLSGPWKLKRFGVIPEYPPLDAKHICVVEYYSQSRRITTAFMATEAAILRGLPETLSDFSEFRRRKGIVAVDVDRY